MTATVPKAEYDKLAAKHARLGEAARGYIALQAKWMTALADGVSDEERAEWTALNTRTTALFRDDPETPKAPTNNPTLNALLEKAKNHVMTEEEHEAQRQSWVRGEMGMGNDAQELAERYRAETPRGEQHNFLTDDTAWEVFPGAAAKAQEIIDRETPKGEGSDPASPAPRFPTLNPDRLALALEVVEAVRVKLQADADAVVEDSHAAAMRAHNAMKALRAALARFEASDAE